MTDGVGKDDTYLMPGGKKTLNYHLQTDALQFTYESERQLHLGRKSYDQPRQHMIKQRNGTEREVGGGVRMGNVYTFGRFMLMYGKTNTIS